MFRVETRTSGLNSSLVILELIYHSTVRSIRRGHRNALVGLLYNILQTVIFIGVFYVMFTILGLRGNSIRGDFIVYIMSGIFLFMTNTKSMSAVVRSEGPTSAMMLHAPMNTAIAIGSSALAALYTQLLSMIVVLGVYHMAFEPVHIDDPVGAMGMFLLAWLNGVGVGMLVLAIKPWWPGFANVAQTIYSRANMIASGKMFVANTLNYTMLKMFDWNPLFHIIDQARGYAFINYNPHNSNLTYPIYVTLALIMIGLIGEFHARKNASISWTAGR
ncbi:ABC transporter permease [Defluviimonas sp. SAOS-178_SWC]|uniref:ABC transporter permease n=1 Tax=Defluviimonas sp. SAOS-178_SWC TaxID=3121287 RepID=UPI0032214594